MRHFKGSLNYSTAHFDGKQIFRKRVRDVQITYRRNKVVIPLPFTALKLDALYLLRRYYSADLIPGTLTLGRF